MKFLYLIIYKVINLQRFARRSAPPQQELQPSSAGNDALPVGWEQRRSAAAAGAFGNYAWRVEATAEEPWINWVFKGWASTVCGMFCFSFEAILGDANV